MKRKFIFPVLLLTCTCLAMPISQTAFASQIKHNKTKHTKSVSHKQLTKEEAEKLLLEYNNKVKYIYQGDASQFKSLKEKNLQGYVFLPDVDTDIGYFVDKNTCSIYFFHPSGYLELVGETKNN
ncbi:hypothetical protein [Romboutsia lituseburensis]|uniref:Uncharacterized protein n=1 Tax=Romboutsia lituseburensis DSM 797 TaxID=1121325 RepID=A0A1G9JB86_9FIRM|nr:hypothetical protein [Romboutsia lituseburensis]CEH33562.1 Hypothetical protein RLITU_0961 [Romboutsia lituseburensis]SDL34552.1 hypothetical protein SAMN04515677_101578 [Romboutsia lituseburensis DSM 797]